MKKKVCLGIDARMYGPKNTGIGRYVANLLDSLAKLSSQKPNWQITLFVRAADIPLLKDKYKNIFHYIKANFSHYSWQEQILFPFILYRAHCHLVHFPHFNVPLFYRRPFVVTIHDLTKHKFKGLETTTKSPLLFFLKHWGYKLIISQAIRRARLIFTPSGYVRKDIARYFRKPIQYIKVAYEGVDKKIGGKSNLSALEKKKILSSYHIKPPFFLYVGNVYPHKNVPFLIRAVKRVRKKYPSLELAIVCSRNIFRKRLEAEIRKMEAGSFVRLTGFVPDQDLGVLYKEALAFVFPSLSEGFGLPGLESMALGTPVVSSSFSCLPEIYGKAALYFHPQKLNSLVAALERIVEEESLRKELIRRGYKQVKKYSWLRMGKEIWAGYEAVLSKTSNVS